MRKIAVIGGGVSGLATAEYLRREGHRAVVLERSLYIGGAIRTIRRDGWLMEAGPDSLLASKPAALELARELGVELVAGSAMSAPGVVRGGKIVPLPQGFQLMAPTRWLPFLTSPALSWKGKLRAALEAFVPPSPEPADESVGTFISRRFGRELMECLAQPLVGGIYAADIDRLSLLSTFPSFRAMEIARGSVTRALLANLRSGTRPMNPFQAPAQGMESLITALAHRIGPSNLKAGSTVGELRRHARGWQLSRQGGEELFDGVVLACSAQAAGSLLGNVDENLKRTLSEIPHVSTATIHFLFEESQLTRPVPGSGFVVPHIEGLHITACTYAHKKYPGRAPAGNALLRVHLGHALDQEVLARDDESLVDLALRELRPLVGLIGMPLDRVVFRQREVLPQYQVHHQQRVRQVDERLRALPGLAISGNGLGGVGISDCLTRARQATEKVITDLKS